MEWVLARWVTFLASVLVAGACAVGLALLPRADTDSDTRRTLSRNAARLGAWSAAALIPAGVMRLMDQLAALQSPGDGPFTGLQALLFSTTWGSGFLAQSAAVPVALLALLWLTAPRAPRGVWWVAALGALGLICTPALQGHAIGSESNTGIAVLADSLHVLGASLWIGSIAVVGWLGVALPSSDGSVDLSHRVTADARLRLLVPLLPPLALSGAVLLIGSGAITAWLHLPALPDIWTSAWGRYVLAKIAITSAVVALGAVNWRRRGPRLSLETGPAALRSALLAELVLAAVALIVTAILVVTPLPGE